MTFLPIADIIPLTPRGLLHTNIMPYCNGQIDTQYRHQPPLPSELDHHGKSSDIQSS
jgi:hypothetical protein